MSKIIFNFDDPSWIDSVNLIYQTLSVNNQRGTLFAVTSTITPELTQLYKQLYNNNWDISSHCVTHTDLTTLTNTQLQSQLNDSYNWFISNGFTRSARYLAYPFGSYNLNVINAAKQNYIIARGVTYGLENTITSGNYEIKCFGVYNIVSPQEVIQQIDNAINQNKILVLLFHSIVTTNPDSNLYFYLQPDLKIISDYLKSKSNLVDVSTFSDILQTQTCPPLYINMIF